MDLRKAMGVLLHHRRRLDKSILADVATLYCSIVASAAVHQSSPQLSSPNMYNCILQLHASGILLIHLDIDMYHVPGVHIHTDVPLYPVTAARRYGDLSYPDTVLGHTKVLSSSTLVSVPYF